MHKKINSLENKILVIFVIFAGIALGFGLFNSIPKIGLARPQTLQATGSYEKESLKSSSLVKNSVSEPLTFSIPSLDIENVYIESVGLDKDGKMDIPKKDDQVAWYNLGAKPGELGSAVIAGHLDTKTGDPAVFYNIKNLKPGDEIIIKDQNAKEYTFSVTDIKTYKASEFPLTEVFGADNKPKLNLITCEGTYDKSEKLYSHRLVVYSELKT